MAYQVIVGQLEARTAVHIGSGQETDTSDALIRRDGAGQPIIPGTAIAGALRALLTRLGPRLGAGECKALGEDDGKPCPCGVCKLMGNINPSDEGDGQAEASRLLIFNATLHGGQPDPLPIVRDGVGIDRASGAAARAGAVKFDFETLPAGTVFDLRIELRNTTPEDEQLLAAALAEWQAGRLWLGGNVARGLGAFVLKHVAFKALDLNDAANLIIFLKGDAPWERAVEKPTWLADSLARIAKTPSDNEHAARCWLDFQGTLQAEGPFLTNDPTAAGLSGFDHAPLLVLLDRWQDPVLPGAGLRGVLRSHAERIARTLATLNAKGRDDFLYTCPACDPLTRRPRKDVPPDRLPPLESCDSLLFFEAGKGGNEEIEPDELCLACQLFGSTRRGSRLIVEDAPFVPDHPDSKPKLKMLDFLAIDRFTGGGSEGLKFDALVLWKPAFGLRFHLDNPESWELGWLALVVRDLAEGWLSVGFGAAKGFGRVKLADWMVRLGYLGAGDDLGTASLGPTRSDGVYSVVEGNSSEPDGWMNLAEAWVQEFNKKVSRFNREKLPALRVDSYFDGQIDKLYSKEVKLP